MYSIRPIQPKDNPQIAKIIRDLRMRFGFPRISRLARPISIAEEAKAC